MGYLIIHAYHTITTFFTFRVAILCQISVGSLSVPPASSGLGVYRLCPPEGRVIRWSVFHNKNMHANYTFLFVTARSEREFLAIEGIYDVYKRFMHNSMEKNCYFSYS